MKQVKKITRNNNNNQQNKKKKNIKSTTLPYQKPIPGNNNANVNNNVKKQRSSGTPRVLCIAEKPSIAKALAFHMSHGKSRERTNNATPMCKIHEFFTYFPPAKEKCSIIDINNSIRDLIISQNKFKIGCSIVYCEEKIQGIITDRDIRIFLEKNNDLDIKVNRIINRNFTFMKEDIELRHVDKNYNYIPLIIDNQLKGIYFNKN